MRHEGTTMIVHLSLRILKKNYINGHVKISKSKGIITIIYIYHIQLLEICNFQFKACVVQLRC